MLRFLMTEVRCVWIILGTDCNLNCIYCAEHPLVTCKKDLPVNDKVYEFLEQTKPKKIIFYGGEPLLYLDVIKKITNVIRNKIGLNGYRTKLVCMTNGKLLTKDAVDFFNENCIQLNLSYDGINSKTTRGYDALKEKRDLLMQVQSICIHSTMTSYSYPWDFFKPQMEFDKEYYRKNYHHILIDYDSVKNCNNSDHEMFNMDVDRIYREFKEIISASHNDELLNEYVVKRLVRIYDFYAEDKGRLTYLNRLCTTGILNYNLGIDGNLYYCHNTDKVIGRLNGSYDEYLQNILDNDISQEKLKEWCSPCPVVSVCRGICNINSPEYMRRNCEIKRAMWMPFIEEAFRLRLIEDRGNGNGV